MPNQHEPSRTALSRQIKTIEYAKTKSNGDGEAECDEGNGGELPDGGDSENYKVPNLKLVDPRERSGKVQQ
jgi:hypothetical protein